LVPTVPSQARSTPAAVSFATKPVGGAGVSAAAAPNTEAFDRSSSVETGATGSTPVTIMYATPRVRATTIAISTMTGRAGGPVGPRDASVGGLSTAGLPVSPPSSAAVSGRRPVTRAPRARVNAEPGRLCEFAAGSMAAVLDSVGDVAGVRPAGRVDGGRAPGGRGARTAS